MGSEERIVALVDMDCFYVQVEQRERPELRGKPTAVVQYNEWRKGGIIAVGYEARAFELVQVPVQRGKADLTKYRQASEEVFNVLSTFDIAVERASIDEAYLDLSKLVTSELAVLRTSGHVIKDEDLCDTFLAACEEADCVDIGHMVRLANENLTSDAKETTEKADVLLRFLVGCVLANRLRRRIFEITQFRASAGIASNKMMAKLACGLNKPNKQTLVLPSMISALFAKTRVQDVRMLGGKLGNLLVKSFQVETMLQLRENVTRNQLVELVGRKTQAWLSLVLEGIDNEPVVARRLPKSIGCSKNFPGKLALCTEKQIKQWLQVLSEELEERLSKDRLANYRTAKSLAVAIRTEDNGVPTGISSRHGTLRCYAAEIVARDALELIQEFNTACDDTKDIWQPSVTMLSLSASRFEDTTDLCGKIITDYFKPVSPKKKCAPIDARLPLEDDATTSSASEDPDVNSEKYANDLKAVLSGLNIFKNLCSENTRTCRDNLTDYDKSGEAVICRKPLLLDESMPTTSSDKIHLGARKNADEQSPVKKGFEDNAEQYIPQSLEDIPADIWSSLPPDIRWELKRQLKSTTPAGEAGNVPNSKPAGERKQTKRKRGRPASTNPPVVKRSLLQFFQPLS
uniref:DNA polymerase eta n=1 Tax=Trichuris muris TaxID=70415 RepID=A0A5S6R178_TRIMR